MSLDNMRGSYGRCPPFLVAGLLVVCIILTFNWWSLSSQNYDLIKQIEELGEQLKISSEEQELCVHHRLSAEGRMKILDAEVAQVRVNLLQERTDNDEMKKTLETKDEELREAKKKQENSQKSTDMCKTELESIKKLGITKDGTIESLELENKQFLGRLNKQKEKIQSLEDELKQAQAALEEASKKKLPGVPAAPEKASAAPPLKLNDNGMAVGGDHERDGAQELERAENEENNAGERGDDANPEEGAGDNGPEGPVGEEPAAQMNENRIK